MSSSLQISNLLFLQTVWTVKMVISGSHFIIFVAKQVEPNRALLTVQIVHRDSSMFLLKKKICFYILNAFVPFCKYISLKWKANNSSTKSYKSTCRWPKCSHVWVENIFLFSQQLFGGVKILIVDVWVFVELQLTASFFSL